MKAEIEIKQWTLGVASDGQSWTAENPDPETGEPRFYAVESGEYGQPLVKKEPSLARELPSASQFVTCTIAENLQTALADHSPAVPPKVCGIYLKLPVFQAGQLVNAITVYRCSLSNKMFDYGRLSNQATCFTLSLEGLLKYIQNSPFAEQKTSLQAGLRPFLHCSSLEQPQNFHSRVTTQDPSVSGILLSVGEYDIHRHVPGYGSSGVYYLFPPHKIPLLTQALQTGQLAIIHNEFATQMSLPSTHWLFKHADTSDSC